MAEKLKLEVEIELFPQNPQLGLLTAQAFVDDQLVASATKSVTRDNYILLATELFNNQLRQATLNFKKAK